jgi:hypothetical protein
VDESGVALPIMAGGQTLDRILELRRSGQPDTLPPPSGFFDPQTGNPIPTSQIGNYSFVKDAQGVFRSVTIVTDPLGEQFYEFNVADPGLLRDLGFLPKEGGTGRAPPSFASTQAAQTQAETFAREQAEAARGFAEEQAEIDRELRLREARLATARDLVNIKSAEAREARTQGTSLAGEDPFRFLAVARGLQGPTGTTPSAGFKQNLLGAAQFQPPDLTGLDSNALESVISKLSQSNAPTGSPTLGFAHGGTIGAGTTKPGDGTVAFDVGEAIGGMPNPETVILRPDGSVEVVQKIGAAQQGGTFDLLRGVSSPATSTQPVTSTQPGVFDLGGFASLFKRLRQEIFRSTNADPGFADVLRGFESGIPNVSGANRSRVRSIFGFLPPGAEQETSAPFQAFAGPVSRIFQGIKEAFEFQGVPNATSEALRASNLIGLLPAPHKIPVSFFQALFPAEKTALVSAYRLAGVSEADFEHLRTAPQLSFAPQGATAVG